MLGQEEVGGVSVMDPGVWLGGNTPQSLSVSVSYQSSWSLHPSRCSYQLGLLRG